MTKRIAIVAALLFVAVALGAVLVPASPDGVKCGNLVSPDWTDEQSDELIDGYAGLANYLGSRAVEEARSIRSNNRSCNEARSTRKIVAASSGGLAIAAPLAILFIVGGHKRDNV